jgi:hypothetical protein
VTDRKYKVKSKKTSMRLIYFIFLSCIAMTQSFAQSNPAADYHYQLAKSSTLSLGVGIPSTTQVAVQFVSLLDQDAQATPQFTLRYEYAINQNIGIGTYMGYYTGETESIALGGIQLDSLLNDPASIIDNIFGNGSAPSTTYRVNVFTLGAHLCYHFFRLEKLDTYSIIRGGYNFVSIKQDGVKNNDFIGADVPQFEYFAGLGARYYFSEQLAIYGEVGNSILSPIHVNLGGTFRF